MKKRILTRAIFILLVLFTFNFSYANDNRDEETQTFQLNEPYAVEKIVNQQKSEQPKNIIFMIGDGMSLSIMYSAWTANRGQLHIDNCEYVGLCKTNCAECLITDSGAGGTAFAIGHKTNIGYIGVDSEGIPHKSVLEIAKENNLSVGLSVTCNILDATPAAFVAKINDRSKWDEIANQYVESDIDFVFGGGWKNFKEAKDGNDLTEKLVGKGFKLPRSIDELENVNDGKVFSLISDNYLPEPKERGDVLPKATMKAVELLNQNENGFFLMVEGSLIDKQAHKNDLELVMDETFDFDRTVGEVLKWAAEDGETLVVITADHETGGLTLIDGDINTGKIIGNFSTGGHSGVMVPVYSFGPKAEIFSGLMENSDLFYKMIQAFGFN